MQKLIQLFLLVAGIPCVVKAQTPTLQEVTAKGEVTDRNIFLLGTNNGLRVQNGPGTSFWVNCPSSTLFSLGGTGIAAPGSGVINITSGANVGIGTSTPSSILDVRGANGEMIRWSTTDNEYIGSLNYSRPDKTIRIGAAGYASPSLTFFTGGNEQMRISNDGNMGIGTTTPSSMLDVRGAKGEMIRWSTADNEYIGSLNYSRTDTTIRIGASGYAGATLAFFTAGKEQVRINNDGNIGIGTHYPQSKLAVAGTITAQRVRVTSTGWADYVFQDNYHLPELTQLEAYIKINRHLPDIPGADQVAKEGVDLGTINEKLLAKIEELTLYLIQQQKEITALKEWKERMESK